MIRDGCLSPDGFEHSSESRRPQVDMSYRLIVLNLFLSTWGRKYNAASGTACDHYIMKLFRASSSAGNTNLKACHHKSGKIDRILRSNSGAGTITEGTRCRRPGASRAIGMLFYQRGGGCDSCRIKAGLRQMFWPRSSCRSAPQRSASC